MKEDQPKTSVLVFIFALRIFMSSMLLGGALLTWKGFEKSWGTTLLDPQVFLQKESAAPWLAALLFIFLLACGALTLLLSNSVPEPNDPIHSVMPPSHEGAAGSGFILRLVALCTVIAVAALLLAWLLDYFLTPTREYAFHFWCAVAITFLAISFRNKFPRKRR